MERNLASRDGKPFVLDDANFMALYEEGMDEFRLGVLPLYTDCVVKDPMRGMAAAFGDFLGNDSPLYDVDTGGYLSWESAFGLGQELYDLSHLDDWERGIRMLSCPMRYATKPPLDIPTQPC